MIYFTKVVNKLKLSSECFPSATKNKNKDCSIFWMSWVSEKSPAGVGFLSLTPFVLAPFRESLFSKITEDPRPITRSRSIVKR